MSVDTRGMNAFGRIGAWVIRYRWAVISIWLMTVAGAAVLAGKAPGRLFSGSGDIEGSQSQRADSLWRADFTNPYGQSLVLAIQGDFPRRGGDSLIALHSALEKKLSALPQVAAVMTPDNALDRRLLPKPGTGTMVFIGLAAGSVRDAEQAVTAVRAVADSVLRDYRQSDPSLAWGVTGRAALTYDINAFNAKDTAAAEKRVIPLTLLILLFVFGTVTAAGIPVLLGVMSTLLCMGLVFLLSFHWSFSNLVQNVASMIGLAVGIDYSLFLIHRYREVLASQGGSRDAALVVAMSTAGKAVFLSGLTVLIGLGSLILTPLMETRSIGWGGCLVVLAAMALSLTFLPALLSVIGKGLEWPACMGRRLARPDRGRLWKAWSHFVLRRAPWAAFAGLAVIAVLSWPGRHTRFGFPETPFLPKELEFIRGAGMLVDMGLEGLIAPLNVILVSEDGGPALTLERVPALHAFSAAIRADTNVSRIFGPLDLSDKWTLEKYRILYADMDALAENAPFVQDFYLSKDGRALLMQVMFKPGALLEDTKSLARAIPALPQVPGLRLEPGGQAVYYNDFDEAMKAAYPTTLGFVVVVTFLAMLAFFRSPLVSLKALVMNAFSVLAGYGVVVWVFQFGHGADLFRLPGPSEMVPLTVPLMLFCIVFGLSMDYEVILLSRIREAWLRSGDNDAAIAEGLAATGRMITGAALIMVAVFGAFAFARMVVVQMLGLGLAVAVLVDALIIRSLLVPAFMKLAGHWNWWPVSRP